MYPSVHLLLDGLLSICQTVSMIHVADSQFNGTSTITCTQRNNLLSLEPFSKANRCLFETSKTPHPTLIACMHKQMISSSLKRSLGTKVLKTMIIIPTVFEH